MFWVNYKTQLYNTYMLVLWRYLFVAWEILQSIFLILKFQIFIYHFHKICNYIEAWIRSYSIKCSLWSTIFYVIIRFFIVLAMRNSNYSHTFFHQSSISIILRFYYVKIYTQFNLTEDTYKINDLKLHFHTLNKFKFLREK